ncbi:MAG: hypothetical protein PQJ60_12790, partial [Spirochaetales bacterium]|nr:hypothetical protein [Spirochaetales bacterium]
MIFILAFLFWTLAGCDDATKNTNTKEGETELTGELAYLDSIDLGSYYTGIWCDGDFIFVAK